MFFAVVGWILLTLAGAYFLVTGCLGAWFVYALGGRFEWAAAVYVVVGLAIMGACIYAAPFVVTLDMR